MNNIKNLCQILNNSYKQVNRTFKHLVQDNVQQQTTDELNKYLQTIKIQSLQARLEYEQHTQNMFDALPNHQQQFAYFLILNSLSKVSMRAIISEITTKIFLQQKYEIDKQLFKDNWIEIPTDYLQQFLQLTNIKLDELNNIQTVINSYMQHKKIGDALKLMNLFHTQIDLSNYMNKFIQLDKAQEFSKFLEDKPKYIPQFVHLLQQSQIRNHLKLATELIKQYHLNKNDYPLLIQNQNKQAVDNCYFSEINNYQRAEERLQGYPFMLTHVVDKLLQSNMIDEALSVVKRNNLNVDIQGNYIPNPLLEQDAFGLTESICYGEDPKLYLTFETYGIQEKDIIFVDEVNQLKEVCQLILREQIVGFDSEFCHYFDQFDCGGIAILQISTRTQVFIIDSLKFREEEVFIQFLMEFFEGPIKKIGHSVSNDINEMSINIKFPRELKEQNMLDLSKIFNEVINKQDQRSVSLANQVYQLFGVKLSKSECFSNWQRRPLRKCQQYYAAMDAFVCIIIYDKLMEMKNEKNQVQLYEQKPKIKQKQKQMAHEIFQDAHIKYDLQYEHLIHRKHQKFLVDEMLKKLTSFMRNLGIDAAQNEIINHQTLEEQAIQEERIIITRDKKFFARPIRAPCFLVSNNLVTEQQFEEVRNYLKFELNKQQMFSRCTKCNNEEIIVISNDDAQKFLNFKYDTGEKINQYWQCTQCQQIYWEGHQYAKSKQRFMGVVNQQN